MPSLPGPLRAAVGFAATAAENVKYLPEKAVELPMLVVSTALQLSLRAQQHYAAYAARGEEILTGRDEVEEVAAWATFDPPVDDAAPAMPEDDAPDADDGPAAPAKPVKARRDTAPSRFDAIDGEPDTDHAAGADPDA